MEKMKDIQILVVDDHPEVLRQIENRLSQEDGFEICKTGTMENAFAHIMSCKPDILLVDPFTEDGLCLSSLKKVMKMLPSITIIVLTAVVDAAAKLELSRIGVSFILEKKISSDQLIDTLRLVEAIHQARKKETGLERAKFD